MAATWNPIINLKAASYGPSTGLETEIKGTVKAFEQISLDVKRSRHGASLTASRVIKTGFTCRVRLQFEDPGTYGTLLTLATNQVLVLKYEDGSANGAQIKYMAGQFLDPKEWGLPAREGSEKVALLEIGYEVCEIVPGDGKTLDQLRVVSAL